MENIHKCNHCTYKTLVISFIRFHVNSQHNGTTSPNKFDCENNRLENYRCGECNFITNYLSEAATHFKKGKCENINVPCLECIDCGFSSYSSLFFADHKCTKLPQVQSGCESSTFTSVHQQDLRKHVTQERGRAVDNIRMCLVPEHVVSNDFSWYKCEHCVYKSSRKDVLRRHIFALHMSKTKCNPHPKEHGGTCKVRLIDNLQYLCEHCAYKTRKLSSLKRHNITKHTKDRKWHRCISCKYKTLQETHLKTHMHRCNMDKRNNSYHNNANPKECPSSRNKHLKKDGIFLCKHCSYKTKKVSDLKRHVMSMHTSPERAKWYKCCYCAFETKTRSYLKTHKLIKHFAVENVEWHKYGNCECKIVHRKSLKGLT